MDYSTIIKYLTAFGPTGLVAALGGGVIFYLLRYTIPAIQGQYAADQKAEREAYEKALEEAHSINRKQADDFHKTIQQMQITFADAIGKVTEALQKERHQNANAQNILGLGLTGLKEEMKGTRDEIRSQTTILAAAIQRGSK
jgi:hypothetical protein